MIECICFRCHATCSYQDSMAGRETWCSRCFAAIIPVGQGSPNSKSPAKKSGSRYIPWILALALLIAIPMEIMHRLGVAGLSAGSDQSQRISSVDLVNPGASNPPISRIPPESRAEAKPFTGLPNWAPGDNDGAVPVDLAFAGGPGPVSGPAKTRGPGDTVLPTVGQGTAGNEH